MCLTQKTLLTRNFFHKETCINVPTVCTYVTLHSFVHVYVGTMDRERCPEIRNRGPQVTTRFATVSALPARPGAARRDAPRRVASWRRAKKGGGAVAVCAGEPVATNTGDRGAAAGAAMFDILACVFSMLRSV